MFLLCSYVCVCVCVCVCNLCFCCARMSVCVCVCVCVCGACMVCVCVTCVSVVLACLSVCVCVCVCSLTVSSSGRVCVGTRTCPDSLSFISVCQTSALWFLCVVQIDLIPTVVAGVHGHHVMFCMDVTCQPYTCAQTKFRTSQCCAGQPLGQAWVTLVP